MPTLTNELILAAIDGFHAQKQRIEAQIADLRGLLSGHAPAAAAATTAAAPTASGRKRRKFSAATRAKMRASQQARWAKIKGGPGTEPTAALAVARPKRKISAAGRKAIAAAQRKRWALTKAAAAKAK